MDSVNVVDDGLGVFVLLTLSDGTLVGLFLPIAEPIRRGGVLVQPDAPALCVVPVPH